MSQQRKTYNHRSRKKRSKSLLASQCRDMPKFTKESSVLKDDQLVEPLIDCNYNSSNLINDEWLLFLGTNQELLHELTEIVNNSHTTRAIIDAKTKMVLGEGFSVMQSERVPFITSIKRLVRIFTESTTEIEELNDLVGSVNTDNETLEEVLYKVISDDFYFGNAFVELIKGTKDGVETVQLRHIPLQNVALQKRNKVTGKIDYVGINCDWKNYSTNEIVKVPMYPNFEPVGASGVERSIIHLKTYATGFTYWGLPSNIAGRFWAMIEYFIPKYNISRFLNGFAPSALVQFFGRMPESEAKAALKNFLDTFTGVGNNSKVFAQMLSDPQYAANIQTINDTAEGSFIDMQKLVTQGIIQANNWATSLSGLATEGKLGNNQQMAAELDKVTALEIRPERRKVIQKIINPFIKENSIARGGSYNGYYLDIVNSRPIGLAGQVDINTALERNEIRALVGYEELEELQNNNTDANDQ